MGNSTPGDNSVEAGFARDMQTHHQQAVEMSFIIRDKTSDQAIRTLAYDIITSQQQQMGQMYGWLQVWGLPQTGSRPPMAWMAGGHGGMRMGSASKTGTGASGSSTGSAAAMPGMATPAQLQQLRDLKGRAADRLFLQLMTKHHQGGLEMARAVQGRTTVRAVTVLARAIETAQTAEIAQMQQMLAERPATT
ncbi:DUF305 domain-containing protein [Flexivirga sp. ID2601S]|uniref:DUF305 domain-containing protein n=2 Tax=Flexivirga aerilata TaxID=1656889 RepID=A0A849ALV8_9MICO|nr:DUF305 domain-containing protein [Flexivirga aerilata]